MNKRIDHTQEVFRNPLGSFLHAVKQPPADRLNKGRRDMVDNKILGQIIRYQHALIGVLRDHQSFQIVLEIFEKDLVVVG